MKDINDLDLEKSTRVYRPALFTVMATMLSMDNSFRDEPLIAAKLKGYEEIKLPVLHEFKFNRNGKEYIINAVDKKRALKKLNNLLKNKK